jgi:hypothetical protein
MRLGLMKLPYNIEGKRFIVKTHIFYDKIVYEKIS